MGLSIIFFDSHQNETIFKQDHFLNNFPISGDEELDTLIKATIAGGGVIPHIHKSLIGKKGEGVPAQ